MIKIVRYIIQLPFSLFKLILLLILFLSYVQFTIDIFNLDVVFFKQCDFQTYPNVINHIIKLYCCVLVNYLC